MGCRLTGRFRQDLIREFNMAAEEAGANMIYFHSVGEVGDCDPQYAGNEYSLFDNIDLDQFDGIVFDGESYTVAGYADTMIECLRRVNCPVVSISGVIDGFININFEDAAGIRLLTEHFLDVHHFTRIGFMSGYLSHPDARIRLDEFRSVMRSRGFPEDGAGMFEGDFWFNKGEEAADFFLSLPERPEAVVCANDYMALSLIKAFKSRDIRVPQDIAVSGYDGTIDGQEYSPSLTTASRERADIAKKAIDIIIRIAEGRPPENDVPIIPRPIINQSCGCADCTNAGSDQDLKAELDRLYTEYFGISYNISNAEAALLKMSLAEDVDDVTKVVTPNSMSFGEYSSFFLMLYTDTEGRYSTDGDFSERSDKFVPIIKVDKAAAAHIPESGICRSCIIPDFDGNSPHFIYIMGVQSSAHLFGYAVMEMKGHNIYNGFYSLWIMNISMVLDNILKSSRINKLIGSLKQLSTKDELTGMLNRRGFELLSHETIRSLDRKHTVCTMVLDMDGLKKINDFYGHHEGDIAIKAAADIITGCCDSGEISARTGGDEFYVFAAGYSAEKLERFIDNLNRRIREYNSVSQSPYLISISYGTNLTEADSKTSLSELLKVSDNKMYEQKLTKPNRR